jgi:hypothetical protein
VEAIIRKLSTLQEAALPPLTRDVVERLEVQLGARLPPELVTLYLHHGGARRSSLPARLLPPKELVKEQAPLASLDWNGRVKGRLLFVWTDDQSNYAAVYADGPATGKVCIIDHDQPSAAPRFGSVAAFYRALFAAHAKDDDLVSLARPSRRVARTPEPIHRRVRRPVAFDPRTTQRIVRELGSLPWFCRVGEARSKHDRIWIVVPVRRALKALDGGAWEHVLLEASNLVTSTLSRTNPDAYHNWNKVIDRARSFFDRSIAPALTMLETRLPGWGEARGAMFGCVLSMFAERYYVLRHGLAPGFFTRLAGVFESGRVPVGFEYPARAGALEDALERGTGKLLVG